MYRVGYYQEDVTIKNTLQTRGYFTLVLVMLIIEDSTVTVTCKQQ